MPELIFHKGGALTTVQDGGRYGFQAYGVPVSGAMDMESFRQSNHLVGNPTNEAGLEITLSGPEIEFTSAGCIALTGADMTPLLNWRPVKMYQTLLIKPGDRLSFGELVHGVRTYVGIGGGVIVPTIMNSKSTFLRGKFGGLEGRSLQKGDRIPYLENHKVCEIRKIDKQSIHTNERVIELRFIAGPESACFAHDSLQRFLSSVYRIGIESDRMGVRLGGQAIKHLQGGDIISSPVSAGTVQITNDGLPIILMADAQTTGGYTRIAQLISSDIPLVAQMKPGDQVKFKELSMNQI